MAGTALSFPTRFGFQSPARRRSGPSPMVAKLKDRLASMAKRGRENAASSALDIMEAGEVAVGGGLAAAAIDEYVGAELFGINSNAVIGLGGIAAIASLPVPVKIKRHAILVAAGIGACGVKALAGDMLFSGDE